MDGADKREHPRVDMVLSVQIKAEGGSTLSTEEIRNISLGGLFISMVDPLPYGAKLEVSFTLPTEEPQTLQCRGEVVWSVASAPDWVGAEAGIGVRLLDLGLEDLEKISAFIKGKLIF